MPPTLYIDETRFHDPPEALALVGGLLLPEPLSVQSGAIPPWYQALLRHPHATEAKQTPVTPQVVRSLSRGEVGPFRLMIVGVRRPLGASQRTLCDIASLAVIVQTLHAGVLPAGSELGMYPERRDDPGFFETQGRFLALVSALRWFPLPDPGVVDRMKVSIYPDEHHVLVGQSLVDHVLYHLRSAVPKDVSGWRPAVLDLLKRDGLAASSTVVDLSADMDPFTLTAWQRLALGRMEEIDWSALAAGPVDGLCQAVEEWARSPGAARLDGVLGSLAPWIENHALALGRGISLPALAAILEGVTCLYPGASADTVDLHRYLLGRVRSHMGDASVALKALSFVGRPVLQSPEQVDRRLACLNAEAVCLTDLRRHDEAFSRIQEEMELFATYHAAFPKVIARGRALGAWGQSLVLSGRPRDAWEKLLASEQEFSSDSDRSFAWTWQLLALARGGSDALRDFRASTVLARIVGAYDSPERAIHVSPYLLWGVLELLAGGCKPADARFAEAARETGGNLLTSWAAQEPMGAHPFGVILRAWAAYTGRDEGFAASRALLPVNAEGLRAGRVEARISLRTLAVQIDRGSHAPELASATDDARHVVQEALGRGLARDAEGTRPYLEAFLAMDVGDPGSVTGVLGLGDY